MTQLTRRPMLVSTAAAAIAATVPLITASPVRAAVPQIGRQAPGFYRYRIDPFYDHYPVKSEAMRRKVLEMLAVNSVMVQGYHLPFPGLDAH